MEYGIIIVNHMESYRVISLVINRFNSEEW